MVNKYGRPKSLNPRINILKVRLTNDEMQNVNDCAKHLETTKTKTVVKAIKDLKEKLDA